jgi:hypothetical protein
MASNLTITAYYTRKAIFWGGIFLVGFIVVKGSLTMAAVIWKTLVPTPPPPPNERWGAMPLLSFAGTSEQLPQTITYKLETKDGNFPTLPDVAKVYFMPQAAPNLLSLERANQKASSMGFSGKPEAIDKSHYRWTNLIPMPVVLSMNINNGVFDINYPYQNDQQLLNATSLPNSDQAAQEAKGFLSSGGSLTPDLASGSAEFILYRYDPPNLVPAVSLSEADFVRVNFFRTPLDGLEVLPDDPKLSLITFLFSGSTGSKRMVEIKYNYHQIDRENFGTYPLKGGQQAWAELQNGKGHIAHLGQNTDGNITIRKIYLAYYEAVDPQTYIQPIYVFEGDRDFFAYVPAIGTTTKAK